MRLRGSGTKRFGGPIHQRIVRTIADDMARRGHKVDVEFPLGEGKSVDLVLDRETAVEVEMRDFSESNLEKNLTAGFKLIVIVLPNDGRSEEFREEIRKRGFSERRVRVTSAPRLFARDYIQLVSD